MLRRGMDEFHRTRATDNVPSIRTHSLLLSLSERLQQMLQPVQLDLVHQPQQLPQLAGRESFGMVPDEVMLGQVGQQFALVFAVGHLHGDQLLEVVWGLGFHGAKLSGIWVT